MHGFAAGETASFAPYRTTFSAVCCVCRRCRLSFGRQLLCRPKAPCTRPAGLSLRGECPGVCRLFRSPAFPGFSPGRSFYGSASSRFRVEKVFPVPECGTGKRMVCPCLEDYFVMASNILPSSSGVTDLLETFTRGVTASTIFFS